MYIVCFSLSMVVLVILLLRLITNKNSDISKIIFPGIAISLFILSFPLYADYKIFQRILMSFIFAFKSITLTQDFKVFSNIELSSTFMWIYYIYSSVLCIICPLATFGFIGSFFTKYTNKIKLLLSFNKNIYVFTALNERTISLVKTFKKNSLIIINDLKGNNKLLEEIKNYNVILTSEDLSVYKNRECNSITFYFNKYESSDNVSEAFKFINSISNNRKYNIYVFNAIDEYNLLIDSCVKNINNPDIHIEVINTLKRVIQTVLYRRPLYLCSRNNKISVLVVGAGKTGIEFIKNSAWCGQILNKDLEINIIDKEAKQIKSKMKQEYPELIDNYKINFIEEDILSYECLKSLQNLEPNYIVISLGNEELNLKVGLMLRRVFINASSDYKYKPVININVKDVNKQKQIETLIDARYNLYNLYTFNVYNMDEHDYIFSNDLEKLSKQIRLAYDPSDINLSKYYVSERNRDASRADALHIKYKMYSILNADMPYLFEINSDYKLIDIVKEYGKIVNEEIIDKLSYLEHSRWNAYYRSIGYKKVSPSDVKKYKDENKHHCNEILKLHPALVTYEELDNVEKQLNIELKRFDRDIVSKIVQIVTNANKDI